MVQPHPSTLTVCSVWFVHTIPLQASGNIFTVGVVDRANLDKVAEELCGQPVGRTPQDAAAAAAAEPTKGKAPTKRTEAKGKKRASTSTKLSGGGVSFKTAADYTIDPATGRRIVAGAAARAPKKKSQKKAPEAKSSAGERRWNVVGTAKSVMQPLGLLDVKPDPVSHKNLNSMLLRTFDKDVHPRKGASWVGVGQKSNYRENVLLREKHEKAAAARRAARATLESKREELRSKLAKDYHSPYAQSTSPPSRRSARQHGSNRSSSTNASPSPTYTSPHSSTGTHSTPEGALQACLSELKNVRQDRKELLEELVQLTDSYDELVRVSEEQIEEAQHEHLLYSQRMEQAMQEKAAELKYVELRTRSTPAAALGAPASRGANLSSIDELKSVIVVMEEALEAQEALLRIKQVAKQEEVFTLNEQHQGTLVAILKAAEKEEKRVGSRLVCVRQVIEEGSVDVRDDQQQTRQELDEANQMVTALEEALHAKERLLEARQAAHEEDCVKWEAMARKGIIAANVASRPEGFGDQAEIGRLKAALNRLQNESDLKIRAALSTQQESFNAVMSEMKMALVDAISAKGELDRMAHKSKSAQHPNSRSHHNHGKDQHQTNVREELADVRSALNSLRTGTKSEAAPPANRA
jgi:hypothetical protein